MMKYNVLKITVMYIAVFSFILMMKANGQEEDYESPEDLIGKIYSDEPDIQGDCGGSLEKIVNETCKTLYYEFPEQAKRKISPRIHNVHVHSEMVLIHNCCDTQCKELDLTALCYND